MMHKQACLQATHELVSVKAGPAHLGFPVRRVRRLGAAVNRARLVWVGPSHANIQRDFKEKFGCEMEADGTCFMKASTSEVHAWVMRLAKLRKITLPEDFASRPQLEYLHQLVPVSAMMHMAEYDEVRGATSPVPFFCDLDHHNGWGPVPGRLFPTAMRHSTVLWFGDQNAHVPGRLAVTGESLSSQGLDVYPEISCGQGPTPLLPIFEALPDRAVRALLGNAMHIGTVAAWIFYVLGNCIRVDDFFSIDAVPSVGGRDGDGDDDDGKVAGHPAPDGDRADVK